LAEARLTKAEGSYKDAVADFRAAQKSLAALQQANEQLTLKLREAEGSADAARQQQEVGQRVCCEHAVTCCLVTQYRSICIMLWLLRCPATLQTSLQSSHLSATPHSPASQPALASLHLPLQTARSSEALLKMSEQLRQLEADNDRLQRELAGARSAAAGLESRLQSAEVREARHLAEAREAEALAAEHEELMAQVGRRRTAAA
jgi:predicted  nucleic acid-binding Zn-ribbon protein